MTSPGNTKTGASFIADAIEAQGTDHVFFVDAILRETLVELERRGIKRILAHSEKSAAYMADGYARVSGQLGICMAQSVGAANLAAGLQDAYLNRTPVLAITGKKDAYHQYRNAYQEIPHAPFFSAVTKYQADVDEIAQLPLLLKQAIREASSGTRRPVHLDFKHYRGSDIEEAALDLDSLIYDQFVAPDIQPVSQASTESIAQARVRLDGSKKPMLVLGVGAANAGITEPLRRFAEDRQIPIATSVGGRGLIETNHPLHVGVVGTYSAPYANKLLYDADLVIYLGCHTGDQVSCDWSVPRPGTPILQIDIDQAEIGRNYPNTIGLYGDPARILDQLGDGNVPSERTDWLSACSSAKSQWEGGYRDILSSDDRPIRAERLARDLSEALDDGAVVVADTGFSATWTAQLTEFRKASQTYLRAAGSLGWAFPAAIGATCAAGSRPVICFTGDGAMHYHSADLETIARWNLPLVTVVNNNSSLGQGLRSVKKLYEGQDGSPDDLVNFKAISFADLAEVYGVTGLRVEDPAEIVPTIRKAVGLKRPVVVDVITDPNCNPQSPWVPN